MKSTISISLAAGAFIFMTQAFSAPSLVCGGTAIKLGTTPDSITKACGSPSKIEKSNSGKSESTLYYIDAASRTTYEFTFNNGKLDSVEIDPLMD